MHQQYYCNYVRLKKLLSFIEENKHLPNVPSENEVKNEGIDLVEMNKVLLQKIEELTLYLIQQDERIKSLEAEIGK